MSPQQNAIFRKNSSSSRNRVAEVQPFISFSSPSQEDDTFSLPLVTRKYSSTTKATNFKFFFLLNPLSSITSIFRSLLEPTCQWLAATSSTATSVRTLTGTFFGHKRGRVSFALQETPKSEPVLLLELATPTSNLVKEMSSGTVRITLECERNADTKRTALLDEPAWAMYCNGRRLGYAVSRPCTASDVHVLGAVRAVSVGAGVMPALPELTTALVPPKNGGDHHVGNVMYMRAKFERVIGNRDSEALYMINPDCSRGEGGGKYGSGGPELSIFLLRI